MELYIVRHGIAEGVREGGADADRALTRKGRKRSRWAAECLARVGCRPDCIATSPLRRARQTADVLAGVLCPGTKPQEWDSLSPDGDVGGLTACLRELGCRTAVVVGHMPGVAEMASQLIAGEGSAEIVFKKAGACRIDFDGEPSEGAGRLVWLMQPRQFADLRAGAAGGAA